MSAIGKKRKIRSGHKAYTTKLLNEATDVSKEEPSIEVKDKLRQLEISLKERLDILAGLDKDILELEDDDDAIIEEIETSGEFRDKIHGVLVRIENQLKPTTAPSSYTETIQSTSKSPTKETVSTHTRLPKLILKRFSGEPRDWISFWDQYKNAVHENTTLSDVDKFSYLKSLLEGNAATTIQSLALTAANYNSAVQLLNQRFGNKQVIISSHMDALLKLTAVSSHDVKGLRKTYDKIEAHVRGLQALDVPTSTYGSLLVPVLMSKIPEEIRLLLGREVKDGEWNLDKILTLLREEVENRERCGSIQALSAPERKQAYNVGGRNGLTTAAALISSDKKVNCSYCKGNHTSAKCPVITNVLARKDILRKEGRCFICLKRGHLSRNCESRYSCIKCTGKHHISICDKQNHNTGISRQEAGNAPYSVSTSNTQSLCPGANIRQPQGFNASNTQSLCSGANIHQPQEFNATGFNPQINNSALYNQSMSHVARKQL